MKKTITAAAIALLFGMGHASAQDLRDGAQPAEFPPSSFTGKQYVDSKGCVFVRAGFDGAITWVPRVNRKRKVLCGMSPTFAGQPAAPRIAAAPKVVPPRVTAPPRTVTPAPVRAKPAPTVRAAIQPTVRAVPKPTVRTRAVAPVVRTRPKPTQAAPRVVRVPTYSEPRVVRAPSAPRTVTAPTRGRTNCPNMSALSQRYMQTNSGYAVRCGPQGTSATGISYDGAVNRNAAPLQVIRVAPGPKIAPPAGYKAVWEDDRLNRNRGVQTAEGYYQSSLVWTNTVPRRLIDSRTGNDVTKLFAWLKYPFTTRRSMEAQVAYRQNIGENPRGRVVQVPSGNNPRFSTKAVAPVRAVPRARVAPVRRAAVPAGHRYVQVGTFGVPANAQNTATRLQRMGLPVRIGNYQKAGKTYRIVLAGPFNNASALSAGLTAARRAGFSDAYTRK